MAGRPSETHEFISVDSFSQLPFMRRSDKPPNPAPIRLFGFEFTPPHRSAPSDSAAKRRSSSPNTADSTTAADPGSGGEPLRKFECNYCFRNFTTSQALGGHQNAHKRERQNAKRANLPAGGGAGGQLQSLLRYHNSHGVPGPFYPSLSFSAGGEVGDGVRFYGGLGSVAQPINGNPMSGIWTAPPTTTTALHHGRAHFTAAAALQHPSLSLLRVGQEKIPLTSAAPPSRVLHDRHEPKADAVSLDLHL
ncbi:Zinc finger protein 6 [Platanthera guangdongensis]|uniref:Zinc finger protein 6 n=1 Tax=Platanthera guangdongensis TaxID=2320717 RepID=A0ABR2MSY6_9ASPA